MTTEDMWPRPANDRAIRIQGLRLPAQPALPLWTGCRCCWRPGAGTGKTFALAHLVLRLVAERGCPCAKLLVVTFTDGGRRRAKGQDRAAPGAGPTRPGASSASQRPSGDAYSREWLEPAGGTGPGSEQPTKTTGGAALLLALEDLDAA